MDKRKIIIKSIFWVLLAALLLLIFVVAVKMNSIDNSNSWNYCADYEQYSDDFNLIKDYFIAEFPDAYDKSLSVSYAENGYQLFDRDIDDYLILPADISLSLNTVCTNAFSNKYAHLKDIIICGETVSFSINDGRCALIYSPQKEPTWIDSSQKYTRVEFSEIRDGWYHAIDKDWKDTGGF